MGVSVGEVESENGIKRFGRRSSRESSGLVAIGEECSRQSSGSEREVGAGVLGVVDGGDEVGISGSLLVGEPSLALSRGPAGDEERSATENALLGLTVLLSDVADVVVELKKRSVPSMLRVCGGLFSPICWSSSG